MSGKISLLTELFTEKLRIGKGERISYWHWKRYDEEYEYGAISEIGVLIRTYEYKV
jgi:hypothetical protein